LSLRAEIVKAAARTLPETNRLAKVFPKDGLLEEEDFAHELVPQETRGDMVNHPEDSSEKLWRCAMLLRILADP
jgi:hypothetical protein